MPFTYITNRRAEVFQQKEIFLNVPRTGAVRFFPGVAERKRVYRKPPAGIDPRANLFCAFHSASVSRMFFPIEGVAFAVFFPAPCSVFDAADHLRFGALRSKIDPQSRANSDNTVVHMVTAVVDGADSVNIRS